MRPKTHDPKQLSNTEQSFKIQYPKIKFPSSNSKTQDPKTGDIQQKILQNKNKKNNSQRSRPKTHYPKKSHKTLRSTKPNPTIISNDRYPKLKLQNNFIQQPRDPKIIQDQKQKKTVWKTEYPNI